MNNHDRLVPWLYLGLSLSQSAHSMEEVATGLWRCMPLVSGSLHEKIPLIPVMQMSEETFVLGNMVIITLILAFSPFPFLNHGWAWKTAAIVAMLETVNGLGHISAAALARSYFPGCIAAVGLVALSVPLWARRFPGRKGPG